MSLRSERLLEMKRSGSIIGAAPLFPALVCTASPPLPPGVSGRDIQVHDGYPSPHGILHRIPCTACRTIERRDQQGCMVHHIAVPPLHTRCRILLGDQRLEVTARHEMLIPLPLERGPGIWLGWTGDRRLHCHIWPPLSQLEDTFAEIEVTAHGHAAQEMAVSFLIGRLHCVCDPAFQQYAPGISLVISPRKLAGTVSSETASGWSSPHRRSPFSISRLLQYRMDILDRKEQKIFDRGLHFPSECRILTASRKQLNTLSSGRGAIPHWRYSPRPDASSVR